MVLVWYASTLHLAGCSVVCTTTELAAEYITVVTLCALLALRRMHSGGELLLQQPEQAEAGLTAKGRLPAIAAAERFSSHDKPFSKQAAAASSPMIITLVPPPPPPLAVCAGAAGCFSTVAAALMLALSLRSMRAAVRLATCEGTQRRVNCKE